LDSSDMATSRARVAFSKLSDGSAKIMILRGRLSVGISDIKTTVSANSVFYIKENGTVSDVKDSPVVERTIKPGITTKVYYPSKTPMVTYIWEAKGENYVFEVSKSKDFKEKEISERIKDNHYTDYSLPPGEYYWRYKTLSGSFSKPTRISTVRTKVGGYETLKVVISEIGSDRTITFSGNPPVILLNWEKLKGASSYEVELFKDESLNNKIFSKVVNENYLSFYADFFKVGIYYWHVKKLGPDEKILLTGPTKRFNLVTQESTPTLRIDLPVNNSIALTDKILVRGQLLKKGSLYVNSLKILDNSSGPFETLVDMKGKTESILFKEISADGTVSYYSRVIYKK